MLLSLLILLGAIALCLFMAWLGMRVLRPPVVSVAVRLEQVGGGFPDGVVGESMQLDSPTNAMVAAESDLVDPDLKSTLDVVLDAVSTNVVNIDIPIESDEVTTKQPGGKQIGDGKVPGWGLGGDGRPGIPPQLRWEISFADGQTLDIYARQLDAFGIELGVLGVGQVTYAKNLSKPRPDVYTGPTAADKRLYMMWRVGRLREADRDLVQKAGINPAGKQVLQFYPDPTEQALLRAEKDFKGRDAGTIRKTRFGVRPAGKTYEFYVIEQTYL